MTRALVHIISPIHVISSVAAVRTLHRDTSPMLTFLVYWPAGSADLNLELLTVVGKLAAGVSNVETIIGLSQEQLGSATSQGDAKAVRSMRQLLGAREFDEIYYSHDIEHIMRALLCRTYPKAETVCFGDGLGNVYEQDYHLSFYGPPHNRPTACAPDRLKRYVKWRILYNSLSIYEQSTMAFKPKKAALILPVDQSGHFLKGVSLTVCRKSTVLEVIDALMENSRDLQEYIGSLLAGYSNTDKTLLLTDNFAEGPFIDFEAEIEMWGSIVKTYCRPNSVLFLKSHPGETLKRNERIRSLLSDYIEVVELNDKFKRYPIELWKPLVENCQVICMSYPVLSLKYLYDIDVIQPMTPEFIKAWFRSWTWDSYENSLELYMVPRARLRSWDGRSVLYSGIPSRDRQ